MDDELWKIEQQSRSLQEYRREQQGAWNDEAAHTLNARYLDPHEEDSTKMLEQMRLQNKSLGFTKDALLASAHHAATVSNISNIISQQLELAQQEIHVAEQMHEHYRQSQSMVTEMLPRINELINQANMSCQGVATQ